MTGTGRNTTLDFLLLLRAVRWYNVALILISQYLIAFFVFHHGQHILPLIQDLRLHLIVLSTSLALAGAFLINGFYDIDKDLVNHPQRVTLFRMLGQNFVLNAYAATVIAAVLLSLAASLKVFVFVIGLVFMFWLYSHKLQKMPLVREITATLLAIAPLIAIWLHYSEMHYGFLIYMGALAITGFTREVVKDLTGNKGNIIFGYQTVVVAAGQYTAKIWLLAVNVLLALAFFLGFVIFIRYWDYYSIISCFTICSTLLISLFCYLNRDQKKYEIADIALKFIIVFHFGSLIALALYP